MATNPTGLQYLADTVMPPMLRGLFGRWVLIKLFKTIRDRKMLPKAIDRWLFRPISETADDGHLMAASNRGLLAKARVAVARDAAVGRDVQTAGALVFALFLDMPDDNAVQHMVVAGMEQYVDDTVVDLDMPLTAIASREDAPIRKPGVGEYPKGISAKGRVLWDEVQADFEEEIARLGKHDPLRLWAASIIIFERMAKAQGIRAFEGASPKVGLNPDEVRRVLVKRLENAYRKGFETLLEVGASLKTLGVPYASRNLLIADPVWRADNTYSMRFFFKFNMTGQNNERRKTVRRSIQTDYKFKPLSGEHVMVLKPLKRMRHVLRMERETNDEWRLYLEFPMTESEVNALTGQRNKPDIMARLVKICRDWKTIGHIPAKEG